MKTIEELIDLENTKRKANNPVVIFVNTQYQGSKIIQPMNIYYAEKMPIEINEFMKDWDRYNNNSKYYNKVKKNTLINEKEFNNFLEKDMFRSLYGFDHNRHSKLKILGFEAVIFSNECSVLNKEKFNEFLPCYKHVPFTKNAIQEEKKLFYNFKSEEEKDIYGHALLDGCSEIEAVALMKGIEIETERIPFINGYFELDEYYRNMFTR